MLNKLICCSLIATVVVFGNIQYSTKAVVTVVGGIIKAESVVVVEKYKRKDCPVCKGKGWYISGDGIEKVDCGYCEPESNESGLTEIIVD